MDMGKGTLGTLDPDLWIRCSAVAPKCHWAASSSNLPSFTDVMGPSDAQLSADKGGVTRDSLRGRRRENLPFHLESRARKQPVRSLLFRLPP